MPKIIVDTLGGDLGYEPIVRGSFAFLKERPEYSLILVGPKNDIQKIIDEKKPDLSRLEIIDTSSFISNHDDPRLIFRAFEGTSLVLSYQRAKEDPEVVGVLSAGNTGAVLVGSIFRLGLLEGADKPCLASALPLLNPQGYVCLVDCGANIAPTAQDLLKFGIYGSAFMQAAYKIEKPRVGLLNVGKEEGKGTELYKEGYKLLKASHLNFLGNMEGNDFLSGAYDVCVTDGFAGNVLLKNSEAVGLSVLSFVKDMGEKSTSLEAKQRLNTLSAFLYSSFAYNDLGCSVLLGPSKIVAKAHGKAGEKTILSSLKQVASLNNGGFIESLKKNLSKGIKA